MGHAKRRFERHMPRIRRHAAVIFRDVKCYHARQDKIQDVLGIAFKWFKQLWKDRKKTGKNPECFISRLADFACRQVKCGRTLAGKLNTRDVLNAITGIKHGFVVGKLPDFSTESANPLQEALIDNTQTPPDEQAVFRLTFPVFLERRSERDQRLIVAMAENHRTKDLSDMFNVSQGRISQMRRELYHEWSSL